MARKMLDFSEAFPRKVNVEQYKDVIDAALNAALGKDNLPRVVAETYSTAKEATRAANAIRKYSKENNLTLQVSQPDGKQEIRVYKGKPQKRSTTRTNAAAPPPAGTEPPTGTEDSAPPAP